MSGFQRTGASYIAAGRVRGVLGSEYVGITFELTSRWVPSSSVSCRKQDDVELLH